MCDFISVWGRMVVMCDFIKLVIFLTNRKVFRKRLGVVCDFNFARKSCFWRVCIQKFPAGSGRFPEGSARFPRFPVDGSGISHRQMKIGKI